MSAPTDADPPSLVRSIPSPVADPEPGVPLVPTSPPVRLWIATECPPEAGSGDRDIAVEREVVDRRADRRCAAGAHDAHAAQRVELAERDDWTARGCDHRGGS